MGARGTIEFEELMEEALAGTNWALLTLGSMYYSGRDVEQNYEEALKWFTQAADTGEFLSMKYLGDMYFAGQGVRQDYKEALKWYKCSVDHSNDNAIYNLAYMYANGFGVDKSEAMALTWLKKIESPYMSENVLLKCFTMKNGEGVKEIREMAECGNVQAMTTLQVRYRYGLGVTEDILMSDKWLETAAETGDKNSMLQIAEESWENYYLELGLEPMDDISSKANMAIKWLQKITDIDYNAMNKLAFIYYRGIGVNQDYEMMFEWLRKAADAGSVSAMQTLGYLYDKDGESQDKELAMSWYDKAAYAIGWTSRLDAIFTETDYYGKYFNTTIVTADNLKFKMTKMAAEAGDVDAMHELSYYYSKGIGTEVDEDWTLSWSIRASEPENLPSDPNILFATGYEYFMGEGRHLSYETAAKLFEIAADAGHTKAMLLLGFLYYAGYGVEKDEDKCHELWEKAAEKDGEILKLIENMKKDFLNKKK